MPASHACLDTLGLQIAHHLACADISKAAFSNDNATVGEYRRVSEGNLTHEVEIHPLSRKETWTSWLDNIPFRERPDRLRHLLLPGMLFQAGWKSRTRFSNQPLSHQLGYYALCVLRLDVAFTTHVACSLQPGESPGDLTRKLRNLVRRHTDEPLHYFGVASSDPHPHAHLAIAMPEGSRVRPLVQEFLCRRANIDVPQLWRRGSKDAPLQHAHCVEITIRRPGYWGYSGLVTYMEHHVPILDCKPRFEGAGVFASSGVHGVAMGLSGTSIDELIDEIERYNRRVAAEALEAHLEAPLTAGTSLATDHISRDDFASPGASFAPGFVTTPMHGSTHGVGPTSSTSGSEIGSGAGVHGETLAGPFTGGGTEPSAETFAGSGAEPGASTDGSSGMPGSSSSVGFPGASSGNPGTEDTATSPAPAETTAIGAPGSNGAHPGTGAFPVTSSDTASAHPGSSEPSSASVPSDASASSEAPATSTQPETETATSPSATHHDLTDTTHPTTTRHCPRTDPAHDTSRPTASSDTTTDSDNIALTERDIRQTSDPSSTSTFPTRPTSSQDRSTDSPGHARSTHPDNPGAAGTASSSAGFADTHPHKTSTPVFTIRTRTKTHRLRPRRTIDRPRSRHETRPDIHRPEPNPIYTQIHPIDLFTPFDSPWRRWPRRSGITRTRKRFVLKTKPAPRDSLGRPRRHEARYRLSACLEQMQPATRSRCALARDIRALPARDVLRPARPPPSTDANKKNRAGGRA